MIKRKPRLVERWRLESQVRGLTKFIASKEQQDASLNLGTTTIEKLLARKPSKFREVMGYSSGSLTTTGMWQATAGGLSAFSATGPKEANWRQVRLGLIQLAAAAWLRHSWVLREKCWDKESTATSMFDFLEPHTLCHAIATGDDVFAHRFGRHLLANFRLTKGGDRIFFYSFDFLPFAFKLYCTWIGEEITFRDDVANPLGWYQQIFDAWHEPQQLRSALLDICDYHCQQALDQDVSAQFGYHPYNIFPVEIMALLRIRKELGLPTPDFEHKLITGNPLLHPPATLPDVQDDLLDRLVAYVRDAFPDVSPPWWLP
ncbi:MAG TPA: hypothetical protein PKD86_04600 [Gemmatales bacterium]|nr:hypothetical protein [Gemmatales bacterium]